MLRIFRGGDQGPKSKLGARPQLAVLSLLVVLVAAGCGTGGMGEASADTARGEQLFKEQCGTCHKLKAAGTAGTQGPDLDTAFEATREDGLGESTIRDVVLDQIRFAIPPMPRNLVKGDDADAVAAYVAEVAANPNAQVSTSPGGEAGGKDPKALMATNCGSCHTFGAAGIKGTVGPNLDQTQKDRAAIIQQITNGGGGMPPFKDVLSEQQIQAIADFIVKNRS